MLSAGSKAPLLFTSLFAGACTVLLMRYRARIQKLRDTAGEAAGVLRSELEQAEALVEALRQELAVLQARRSPAGREVRIWMDGAFDMMHYGHANAFRKGRALGTHLIVGVNDDVSITQCKGGPPLMSDSERLEMVRACKWVDEVVPGVPYIMSEEYLSWAIREYRIDYVVHGDDPCIVDGRDVYESARKLGKYRTIPRTEGVSTTEIVGRMLLASREHHTQAGEAAPAPDAESAQKRGIPTPGTFVRESRFLTTSQMVRLFSDDCSAPAEGARIVYVDGGWDMFHAGHVAFLQAASQLGDYLLVGVHSDAVVNRHRGHNYPILNQQERVLSVLACRYTSDVVIDPPWYLTREMIAALRISVVAHGTAHDHNEDESDPYHVPKQMGIFVSLPSTTGARNHAPEDPCSEHCSLMDPCRCKWAAALVAHRQRTGLRSGRPKAPFRLAHVPATRSHGW